MKSFAWILLGGAVVGGGSADAPRGAAPGSVPVGPCVGVEHVAFVRAGVPGGLVGPARECGAGDPRDLRCTVAPDGAVWVPDSRDCVIYRIKDGQARIIAGCGVKGYRDGPADRAMFDLGVGPYNDCEVNADAAGNIYVSDMMNDCIRKIFRKPDGDWWVTTVSGGGEKRRTPKKGASIPAKDLKPGGASRFAVAPDGTIYYANGGIFMVKDGQGTCLASYEDLRDALQERAINDWHVGGSHITPDGWFYWVPGGQKILRFHTKTGKAEVVAGNGPKRADGPSLLESGFHTVVVVYSPDASVIYTGGGDELVLRRIAAGAVKHLQKDGTFKAVPREIGWALDEPVCLDREGRLYTFPGPYCWSGWLVRATFEKE